jgi:hypothetical protein
MCNEIEYEMLEEYLARLKQKEKNQQREDQKQLVEVMS